MTLPSEAAARRKLDDLPGISRAPFSREDLPDIAAFYTECETYDENPERASLGDLQEFWDSPRSVPEADTLLGRDDDWRVVATDRYFFEMSRRLDSPVDVPALDGVRRAG